MSNFVIIEFLASNEKFRPGITVNLDSKVLFIFIHGGFNDIFKNVF